MKRPDYTNQIRKRIEAANAGAVFVTADFTDIAEKKTVNMALLRLAEEGILKKAMFGVYFKTGVYKLVNKPVEPSPVDIAKALARNFGWTIVPCGETALHALGLSNELSSEWVYVTDGEYKEYAYKDTVIKFKKVSTKEISRVSYATAVYIQAIKALGKDNITEQTITHLKKFLNENQKARMLEEAKPITSWVYEAIRKICIDN